VWVDDLSAEAHPMTHDLCAHHAEHTRVPKGWELRDRRIPAISLTARISA
jgi:hypothetical protein